MKARSKMQKIFASTLALAITFGIVPGLIGNNTVLADTTKNKDNTCLGTTGISNPVKPTGTDSPWQGSYVYFGSYDTGSGKEPIKFRVLNNNEDAFGAPTLFLDSDKILFYKQFNETITDEFDGSEIDAYLANAFQNSFTGKESQSIAESVVSGRDFKDGLPSWIKNVYKKYTYLDQNKVFLLDIEDVLNPKYGYYPSEELSSAALSRRKLDLENNGWGFWWLRSGTTYYGRTSMGEVDQDGTLSTNDSDAKLGVAPALNVKQSYIIFSTAINGKLGETGTEYKLTVYDKDIKIDLPRNDAHRISIEGTQVYIPYTSSGSTSESVLILDKLYGTEGATIKYYGPLSSDQTFDMADTGLDFSGWDNSYYVYVVGEVKNGDNKTDYASVPQRVYMRSSFVLFNTNGLRKSDLYYYIKNGNKVPVPTAPEATGYTFDGWYSDSACTKPYDFNSAVTTDFTLYAKWKAVSTTAVKDQSNSCLSTSKISSPLAPTSDDSEWSGSYVYFGNYGGVAIKFRVLAPSTTKYGGNTMFLDSDELLFDMPFRGRNSDVFWADSDIKNYLNGDFLDSFTPSELSSIANSTIDTHQLEVGNTAGKVPSSIASKFRYSVPLTGEKVFILDAEEVSNLDYGYSHNYEDVANRVKYCLMKDDYNWWFLRSMYAGEAGLIYGEGYLSCNFAYNSYNVAPALNVDRSKILFSTAINGKIGETGTEYKLTLLDDNLTVKAGSVSLSGSTLSCNATGNADQLSILITDGTWNSDSSSVKYYGTFTGSLDLSTVDLNGTEYHIYLIAEDINDQYETDYASAPVEIAKPSAKVTFNANGKGTTPASQTVVCGGKVTKPSDLTASGFNFGGWYTDSACTKAYDFNSVVVGDVTLYAKWTSTSTPTPTPEADEKSFEDFVERLYTVALNRPSEPEGKAFWCEHVGNGDLNGAQCANEFLLSKEFKDRNLSDEEFLKVLYKTFFDRDAADDPDGFNFWMNCLKTQGRDSVVDCFINSEEWCNVCASYGVKSGATRAKATVASKNATAFATRLYTECLGREPEEGGLKFWSLGLTNLELSGKQAAHEFFFSKEFNDFNLDNKGLLTRMYTTFMGRQPDTDGMNYWLNEMSNGMTKEQVFDCFVNSAEFTQICKDYAIDRG